MTFLIKPVSSACNLSCKYCFYRDTAEHRETSDFGIMSREVCDSIIKSAYKIARKNDKVCTFAFQGGEPLLAGTDFFQNFVNRAYELKKRDAEIEFSIQTNATLITPQIAEFLSENNFLCGVSLDGRSAHNKNRGDGFNEALNGLKLLLEYGCTVNVLCVVTPLNVNKGAYIYDFFRSLGLKHMQFIPCIPSRYGTYDMSITSEQYYGFLRDVYGRYSTGNGNAEYTFVQPFDDFELIADGELPLTCGACGFCSGKYFTIEANGNVYPCDFYCDDSHLLGNILTSDFEDMFDCSIMKDFINESLLIPEKCLKCGCRRFCNNGCKRQRGEDGVFIHCEAYKKFLDYLYKIKG